MDRNNNVSFEFLAAKMPISMQTRMNLSSDVIAASPTPYTDIVKTKKVTEHVRRAVNAFMWWAQCERHHLNAHNHECHQRQKDLSVELSKQWASLPKGIKNAFLEEAAFLRYLHKRQFPSYKFEPMRKAKLNALPNPIKCTDIHRISHSNVKALLNPIKSPDMSLSKVSGICNPVTYPDHTGPAQLKVSNKRERSIEEVELVPAIKRYKYAAIADQDMPEIEKPFYPMSDGEVIGQDMELFEGEFDWSMKACAVQVLDFDHDDEENRTKNFTSLSTIDMSFW